MANHVLLLLISFVSLSLFLVQDTYADSEYFVYNTKGSYNLGCELDNSCFEPYITKIMVGDVVTWENNDDAIHVVVSGDPNSGTDGLFDSGFLKMNESFSYTFNSEGNFRYFCTLHPWMNGLISVGDVEVLDDMPIVDYETTPVVLDDTFEIEEFVTGLFVPVNMEFVGDDLLVLEKNTGTVRHIVNNKLLQDPVLDVEVSNYGEHGLL